MNQSLSCNPSSQKFNAVPRWRGLDYLQQGSFPGKKVTLFFSPFLLFLWVGLVVEEWGGGVIFMPELILAKVTPCHFISYSREKEKYCLERQHNAYILKMIILKCKQSTTYVIWQTWQNSPKFVTNWLISDTNWLIDFLQNVCDPSTLFKVEYRKRSPL